MKIKSITIFVLCTIIIINLFFWLHYNQPVTPEESRYPIRSISFNPYQRYQSPLWSLFPSQAEIDQDLKKLNGKTLSIRIYSSTHGEENIPELAKKYKLRVIASAWLDTNTDLNQAEIESAIKLAMQNSNVTHLILGNETQLHNILSREELLKYLREARAKLITPVSTAEPWDFWLRNPELVKEVDFIAIHVLPYWVEVPVDQAVDYVIGKYNAVKQAFPNKPVMIAETGWPSEGPQRGAAIASPANQASFFRDFITRAEAEQIPYNIIEAFDQPWKSETEGRAGSHWGIMDADRTDKFPLTGPVLDDPNWRYWAASSIIIGFLSMTLFLVKRSDLTFKGKLFSAFMIQGAVTIGVQLAREASDQYMNPGDIVFWTVMISTQALLAIILLTDAAEIADVIGNKPLKRKFLPHRRLPDDQYPMVSIHLACCKEPPEMVIATLNSLAKLDYPNFEVIVVDNNTPEEKYWRPVQRRCWYLGNRFRFYTLGKYPGFKAGALNFALKVTDPEAKIIGVVDADYIVEKNWLSSTVPYFSDSDIALVQAPQEHRGWEVHPFQTMENDEYTGFFRIGMVQRNEANAIIQHGTMTLISRETLQKLNGWAEWCICEDAELGLRILNEGKKSIYIDHAFGRGLVPDSYEAYTKQRFRWAYGGMRITRAHWRKLFGLQGNLSIAQRYHFIKGWLPWIGDALHMLFTFAALLWSAILIYNPQFTEFPAPVFVYPALSLVILRLLGTAWTYASRVKIGHERTFLAMIAGGALTHSIAKAVIQGLVTSGRPFYRTPKMDKASPLLRSIIIVREEILLALSLNICAIWILTIHGLVNKEAILWSVALITQSFPYLSAVIASLVSSFPMQQPQYSTQLPVSKPATPVLKPST